MGQGAVGFALGAVLCWSPGARPFWIAAEVVLLLLLLLLLYYTRLAGERGALRRAGRGSA